MALQLSITTRLDPDAVSLHEALYREADERGGQPTLAPVPPIPADLSPPGGLLVIARDAGEAAAIGGIRHLDTEVAEVKSMFVAPRHRRRGFGRRILAALEMKAREHDCRAVRLDSSRYLTEAVALYRSAGYREVDDYNGNSLADIWFERSLAGS